MNKNNNTYQKITLDSSLECSEYELCDILKKSSIIETLQLLKLAETLHSHEHKIILPTAVQNHLQANPTDDKFISCFYYHYGHLG